MKILIFCAGSLGDGLDSAERGESRWAQNLARLLGKSGYNVVAVSAGSPGLGKGRPSPGVTFIPESKIKQHGPFDLYIDSCWFEGKTIPKNCKFYFHVHWSLEDRLRSPLPNNHFIIYPYFESEPNFIHPVNQNISRTFFLPTPFCEVMQPPSFSKKGFLWPCRPADVFSRPGETSGNGKIVVDWVGEYLKNNLDYRAYWLFGTQFNDKGVPVKIPTVGNNHVYGSVPYNEVLDMVGNCKLNMPVNLPSCSIDAAVAGVPSLVWQYGGWPGLVNAAAKNGVLIPSNPSSDQVIEVIEKLMTNEEVYSSYVRDLQHVFRHHTEEEVLRIFKEIESKL